LIFNIKGIANTFGSESAKAPDEMDEQLIKCCGLNCGVFFSKADKSASVHQRLCTLHYSDLIAHSQLLNRMEAIGVQDFTDFDVPGKLDSELDSRTELDDEPIDAGELIIGESELCKSFSVNKVYSGPKNATEIGRMLRDAHLHSKM